MKIPFFDESCRRDREHLLFVRALLSEPSTLCHPVIVRMCYGHANAAVLHSYLSRVVYDLNDGSYEDGWYPFDKEAAMATTGLGHQALRKARKKLIAFGHVEEKAIGQGGRIHFRLLLTVNYPFAEADRECQRQLAYIDRLLAEVENAEVGYAA